MRYKNLLPQILISATLALVISACSSTNAPVYDPNNLNSNQTLHTQYKRNGLYYYCQEESCVKPTKLEQYTAEDLQPLRPDTEAPVIVVKDFTPVKSKPKHKKRKLKKKPKSLKPKSTVQTRCFFVSPNESGTVQIQGNKLVPVTQSNDVQIMNSLESAVKTKPTAPVNKPVKVAPTTKSGKQP